MGERPSEIVERIHEQREQLGEHLAELEMHVHDFADWRKHYERHPHWFLGAALGGGLLLSGMLGRSDRQGSSNGDEEQYFTKRPDGQSSEMRQRIIDPVKVALISYGAARVQEMLSRVLPGLGDHFEQGK